VADVKFNMGSIEGGRHYFPARVFYNHTDMGGVMYYANYLRIAEEARCAFFAMLRKGEPAPEGGDFVVRSAHAEYMKPAVFGDELTIETDLEEIGRAYLHIRQKIMRDAELLAEVAIKAAYVEFGRIGRPQRIPAFWLEKFKK
jgi:acyl-CoA thioester hydrolase